MGRREMSSQRFVGFVSLQLPGMSFNMTKCVLAVCVCVCAHACARVFTHSQRYFGA